MRNLGIQRQRGRATAHRSARQPHRGDWGRCARALSLELRNVSLELRNVSLELRNVSLELRNVSLELRTEAIGPGPSGLIAAKYLLERGE